MKLTYQLPSVGEEVVVQTVKDARTLGGRREVVQRRARVVAVRKQAADCTYRTCRIALAPAAPGAPPEAERDFTFDLAYAGMEWCGGQQQLLARSSNRRERQAGHSQATTHNQNHHVHNHNQY